MKLNEFDEMTGYHMNSDNMNRGKQYPIAGFAPGNYQCKCLECDQGFIGDKRAVHCEPCAEKIVKANPRPSKYELLKDWPYESKGKIHLIKAGCIAERDGMYLRYPDLDYAWSMQVVENNPDFFRKVEEKKEKFVKEIRCIPEAPFKFAAFITTSKGGDLREVQEKIEAALNGDLYTEEDNKAFAVHLIKVFREKYGEHVPWLNVEEEFEKWKEARK